MHDPIVAKVLNPEEWFDFDSKIAALDITTWAFLVFLAVAVALICFSACKRVLGLDDM